MVNLIIRMVSIETVQGPCGEGYFSWRFYGNIRLEIVWGFYGANIIWRQHNIPVKPVKQLKFAINDQLVT